MTTKAKTASPSDPSVVQPVANSWFIPPLTLETRLVRIQALGQRIAGHIAFIGGVTNLGGASAEAKQKTVAAFYERKGPPEKGKGMAPTPSGVQPLLGT
jgi:hypothetical protein